VNWLNIELPTLRSEEFLGSEPVERATWLCLMAYCADQENSGVIKGCNEWSDRKLQQIIGVTAEEIRATSDLWSWTGNNLRLWGYPVDKEEEIKACREAGRKGGRPKKSASEKSDSKPGGSLKQNPPVIADQNPGVPNRLNGKERKGKEGNKKGIENGQGEIKNAIIDNLRKVIDKATGGNITNTKLRVEYDILMSWATGIGLTLTDVAAALEYASTSHRGRPLTNAKAFTFEYGKIHQTISAPTTAGPSQEEINARYAS